MDWLTGKPEAFRTVLRQSRENPHRRLASFERLRMQRARQLLEPVDESRSRTREQIVIDFVNAIVQNGG